MLHRDCRSVLLWTLIASASLWAAAAGAAAANTLRLIDERDRVSQANSVHPMAQTQFEVARTKADLPMERMILSLALRPGAQESLERLLAGQQDPQSPLYHQWLTPEQFGARFGLRDEDLKTVKTWLTDQGFTVDEVAKGRGWINFSGTVAQVERAFATEIHDYKVDGKLRRANAVEISIPRGLADLVQGVVSLHSFPRQAAHTSVRKASLEELNGKMTFGDGSHGLAPADFATIYNLTPLYNAGFNGAGQTVAIAGRTDINLSDAQFFRTFFGLPANDPVFVHNGADPGNLGGDEELHADLDVQWAGAVARNATIKLVISKSTTTDGVDLSAQYIVNNNLADAMSTSFSQCEAFMSPTQQTFYNNLWAQAAAQGITSVVSSGDSGAAGCSLSGSQTVSSKVVNGLCSTPYNLCVGGTQFDDIVKPDKFWAATNDPATKGSALSYIPEIAWNESGALALVGSSGYRSSGGGASIVYPKPVWQAATGVPADGRRDVPDVSLNAGYHDGYLVFQGHSATNSGFFRVGGTGVASSSFAGMMALLTHKTGMRQGNLNSTFYSMAASQFAGTGPVVFHDITSGNNTIPGITGFSCTPGYDLVTGLGSVDAAALINNWIGPQIVQFPVSVNTSATPSVVSFNGTAFVFYKGPGTDQGIYFTKTTGPLVPGHWTNAQRLPFAINTSDAPSAIVHNSAIHVVYKGSTTDQAIYVARSSDSITWSMTKFPAHVTTSTGPTAFSFGGTLYVFYKNSIDSRMYLAPLPDFTTWTFVGANP